MGFIVCFYVWFLLLLVLVRVSVAVKRHHGHYNSYQKENTLLGWLSYSSEVQSIMLGSMQTWYWLCLDQKAAGSGLTMGGTLSLENSQSPPP